LNKDTSGFLVQQLIEFPNINAVNQKNHREIMVKKNWAPQHLKLVYGIYKDKIVNAYLDGELSQHLPKWIQQKF